MSVLMHMPKLMESMLIEAFVEQTATGQVVVTLSGVSFNLRRFAVLYQDALWPGTGWRADPQTSTEMRREFASIAAGNSLKLNISHDLSRAAYLAATESALREGIMQ